MSWVNEVAHSQSLHLNLVYQQRALPEFLVTFWSGTTVCEWSSCGWKSARASWVLWGVFLFSVWFSPNWTPTSTLWNYISQFCSRSLSISHSLSLSFSRALSLSLSFSFFFFRFPVVYTCLLQQTKPVADGHTASNTPDLFRPPKLSGAGPG